MRRKAHNSLDKISHMAYNISMADRERPHLELMHGGATEPTGGSRPNLQLVHNGPPPLVPDGPHVVHGLPPQTTHEGTLSIPGLQNRLNTAIEGEPLTVRGQVRAWRLPARQYTSAELQTVVEWVLGGEQLPSIGQDFTEEHPLTGMPPLRSLRKPE